MATCFRSNLVLASCLAICLLGSCDDHKQQVERKMQADFLCFKTALDTYRQITGTYPTTKQGLDALVHRPAATLPRWYQLMSRLPNDPWNTPYVYHGPESGGEAHYDLLSLGPDRVVSGDDTHALPSATEPNHALQRTASGRR